ncbi:hypothetical protein CCACVL1_19344 [Corchorus capsularis]|uniref:Uncharacterized protein n=1 Tax=Corchorus capsularis TaxID=210143 RepID=A0A1R3HH20_COCAP|nr:hypothetical protein CCACVL1_19344 [Corchorus capsularis]
MALRWGVHVSRVKKRVDVGKRCPGYTGSIRGPEGQGPRKKGQRDHASGGPQSSMVLLAQLL